MSHFDAHTEQLLAAVFTGVATSEQFAEFSARLSGDDALLDEYIRLMRVDAALYFQLGSVEPVIDRANRDEVLARNTVVPFAKPSERPPVAKPVTSDSTSSDRRARGGPVRSSLFRYAAAAALLLIAGVGGALLWPDAAPDRTAGTDIAQRPADPQPIATLTDTRDAQWESDAGHSLLDLGSPVDRGRLRLAAGSVELLIQNTATVKLVGPTDLEVLGPGRCRLHHGRIIVTAPEMARGFTVETSTHTIVDLGTRFGVDVDSEGLVGVHVFEGSVEVTESLNSSATPVRLTAERALRREKSTGHLVATAADAERFVLAPTDVAPEVSGAWRPLADSVEGRGEIISLTDVPASLEPHRLERQQIVLLRERTGVRLARPLAVNVDEPGVYATHGDPAAELPVSTTSLAEGVVLDSYLLHFDPIGRLKGLDQARKATAVVRFDRPILGLITNDLELDGSDAPLGLEGVSYGGAINEARQKEGMEGLDYIDFSPDRRTITVRMVAALSIDQLRVIVAGAP